MPLKEIVSFLKTKCLYCSWSAFKDDEVVGMTPCPNCNSTGYIYEEFAGYLYGELEDAT